MPRPGPQDLVRACRAAGVTDSAVLLAVAAVHRAEFVSPDARARAYADTPLPIPHGQVTTQPSLVARMIEALSLGGTERVLEVGTGYGWQTALLGRLAAEVWTIERHADIAATAREHLAGHANVHVEDGDGSTGLAEQAPFDGILVAAAYPGVPPPLAEQLAPGGRLVQPLGHGGAEEVLLFEKHGTALVRHARVCSAHFVRLYGRHGFREAG